MFETLWICFDDDTDRGENEKKADSNLYFLV